MRNFGLLSLLWLASVFAFARSTEPKIVEDAVSIAAIHNNGIELNILNSLEHPISIWICEKPKRLNGLGFELQWFTGKEWKGLKPSDVVLGDSAPSYLEIAPKESVLLPVEFSPALFGVSEKMNLRLVIRAWRTEPSLVFGRPQVAPSKGDEPNEFKLISPEFTFGENSQRAAWALRFDGIAQVRVGMTLKELNTALERSFSAPAAEDEQACYYLELKEHPDTAIMMLDGRVARVDVHTAETSTSSTATSAGIRVGDSEDEVRKLYGNGVMVEPHHYTEGHYLTIRSGKYGMRFETDQNKVTMFYAGTPEAIQLVEGCS